MVSESRLRLIADDHLTQSDLRDRAARIRLLLTDSDGVLTDGSVFYSEQGESFKRFSVRDGMGVERLRTAGIESGIITREKSGSVKARAAKLQLRHVYLGVADKREQVAIVARDHGLSPSHLAYIGDDVNDCDVMTHIRLAGLTGAPADAMPAVLAIAQYHCRARGGEGAFREFAEWILALREGR